MKNQLTTIAALPNGAGQAAHLPAEVGETAPEEPGCSAAFAAMAAACMGDSRGVYAFEQGGAVHIGDVRPHPADKHGFEAAEYTERS